MTATIRFTLPAGVGARDLPRSLRPLAEIGTRNEIAVRTESPVVHVQMLSAWALERGLDLPDLDLRRPTLEDVYLALTTATTKEPR
jgi:ABC-2 type transport system ATP-binding protein